ncbi:MAG: M50 family metallopeptidase, partial [Candidatus Gracilibacteria bacterium]|nr:M50 family metallopeptidase [Candidatus Gracilibacteria bacterium]
PVVSGIMEGSAAINSDLKQYDLIVAVGENKFNSAESVIEYISQRPEQEITLSVKNAISGKTKEVTVVPGIKDGKGFLGIGLSHILEVKYTTATEKIFSGVIHSVSTLDYSIRVLGSIIGSSFAQKSVKPLSNTFVGPVGILALTGTIADEGIWQILNFIAVLSLGLALINVFPIPAADGGKMLFVIYEAIFKKNAPEKFERNFNLVGFIILIGLSLLIAVKDYIQFFGKGKV